MQAEEVFRSANERVAEKARELGWRFPVPFLCESSERRCFGRIKLTRAEYELLRSHPERYMTLPGHEVEDGVVIEEAARVAYVEKLCSYRSA
jgi:hypothetical protein